MLHSYSLSPSVSAFTTRRSLGRDRERICQLLGIADRSLIIPHQTHGTSLLPIDSAFLRLSDEERKERLEGTDAVATNIPGVCIGVSTADCIPVLLYDPANHAAAAAHAGWRGTVERIAEKTVSAMTALYGSRPADLHAVIGPGIQLPSFEVGEEVYDAFATRHFPMHRIARRYPSSTNPDQEKWHLDLPLCNRLQLLAAGLEEENIQTSPIDTYTSTHLFFSARVEQPPHAPKCGRNFNAILLS